MCRREQSFVLSESREGPVYMVWVYAGLLPLFVYVSGILPYASTPGCMQCGPPKTCVKVFKCHCCGDTAFLLRMGMP